MINTYYRSALIPNDGFKDLLQQANSSRLAFLTTRVRHFQELDELGQKTMKTIKEDGYGQPPTQDNCNWIVF